MSGAPWHQQLVQNPQMARYTDTVSPLTDLAVVYGTKGFQMGFGFVTVAMPQVIPADRARVGCIVLNFPSSIRAKNLYRPVNNG